MTIITLEPYQDAFAVEVANRRQQNAIEEHRTPGNNLVADNENDLVISTNGTRAEAAAKLYLNPVKWNAFKKGRLDETADLEDWIDVKCIMEPSLRLLAKPNSKPHWAYFLVDGSKHPAYRMLCWCWGYEAMHDKYWDDPTGRNRAAWFVPQSASFMRSPSELLALVRRRQVVCAQCGGGEGTDPSTDAPTVQHGGYWLHKQCVRFFK